MKTIIVAVFDKKTGLYDNPFQVRHIGDAIRGWDKVRKDPNTKYGLNPEDFDLFQIGHFDDETGKYDQSEKFTHLASGVN